jgi:hypothetical protein
MNRSFKKFAGKWIQKRAPFVKVGANQSLTIQIEDNLPDCIKTGLFISSIILEKIDMQQKVFKCKVAGCERDFKSPFSLRSHLEFHEIGKPKIHECTECGAQFCRSQGNLGFTKI